MFYMLKMVDKLEQNCGSFFISPYLSYKNSNRIFTESLIKGSFNIIFHRLYVSTEYLT